MNELQKKPVTSRFQAAVFIDRDGTIIEDRGNIADLSDVVFFPETFDALSALQKQYRLFIVTNQSGVAKGRLDINAVHRVNQYIMAVLKEKGIEITDIYVCPHQREDGCACIKPNSFFLEKAAVDHEIDLRRSFSVGDRPCDVQLAARTGGEGIYLLTGLLSFGPAKTDGYAAVEILSQAGNLIEAAANLFAAMRRLDEAGLDLMVASKVPNQGMGWAINDRLCRAAQKQPVSQASHVEENVK